MSEKKICQNCKKSFAIEPEDFQFYEKMRVPPPTWCPECRNMRRMAAREIRTFYRDTCKLCGRAIISIHAPDGPFTIYCRDCWQSDKWDPMDYGREYDWSQPFFPQFRKLMEAVPRPALTGTNSVRSEFTSGGHGCKNCYMVFLSYYTEDSQNSWGLLLSRSAYDCFISDNSDHAYETLHVNRMYRVRFAYFSDDCMDSSFLFNCVGCSDCFGCVNLRKKKYCLWNEQLSKEEYAARMKYWDLGDHRKLREAKDKFRALYLALPHRYAQIVSSRNVTGDVIRDAKDCQSCFSVLDGVQNCKYVYFAGLNMKDSYDVSGSGDMSELLYESTHCARSQNCSFANGGGNNSRDTRYCIWTDNCSELFACVNLRNKRHCVFNKQYGEKEYEELVAKIIAQMNERPYLDRQGRAYRYGEFFPPEFSAFPYNQSFAFDWYPKTKEEIEAEGWQWTDPPKREYSITLRAEDLPDHVRDASDSILAETIGCEHAGIGCNEQCTTAFRITKEELGFYREMNLALPRMCPGCRYTQRLGWRNKLSLYRRRCDCPGAAADAKGSYKNTTGHSHGEGRCTNEFETTFPPTGPETVYCEDCFKSEFL